MVVRKGRLRPTSGLTMALAMTVPMAIASSETRPACRVVRKNTSSSEMPIKVMPPSPESVITLHRGESTLPIDCLMRLANRATLRSNESIFAIAYPLYGHMRHIFSV